MRKLLFSALACVAFAGSTFASNEVVVEKQDLKMGNIEKANVSESEEKPCTFRIIGRDAFGRYFDTTWRTVRDTTSGGCDAAKTAKIEELEEQGATIERTVVTWG